MKRIRILFVCMGNICRSPLAEGVFLHKVNERGMADHFDVDSAGTGGWHAGEPADPRMCQVASRYGVKLASRARQVRPDDFDRFDLLLCADEQNRRHLLAMGAPAEKTRLLLEFAPDRGVREVPDPYYGGAEGFETVWSLINEACDNLIDQLLAEQPS